MPPRASRCTNAAKQQLSFHGTIGNESRRKQTT
jgi:hypothetical protein